MDVDKSPKLSKKYKIEAMPTSMVFNKGKLVSSWMGLTPQDEVENKLKEELDLTAVF